MFSSRELARMGSLGKRVWSDSESHSSLSRPVPCAWSLPLAVSRRVWLGPQLGREPTDEGGRPKRNVFVCSATTDVGVDAKGSEALMMAAETKAKEAMRQATLKAETPAETRARLEREAAASRHAVAASVNEALQQRKSVAAGARPARGGMMTALLSFSGDDSASEEA